jgi:hypothetical protein
MLIGYPGKGIRRLSWPVLLVFHLGRFGIITPPRGDLVLT